MCREFVLPDHLCYMQPIGGNKEKTDSNMVTKEVVLVDGEADEDRDNDDSTSYIFFDFECVQESGVHEPNLCIAHTVCCKCMDEEDVTSCPKCGRRELEGVCRAHHSSGVLQVAFQRKQRGCCRSFVSQLQGLRFVLYPTVSVRFLSEVILNGAKVMSITVPATDPQILPV